MNKTKRNKKIVHLEGQEAEIKNVAASRKFRKPLVSFDAYFQLLMKRESRIVPHHKAPMRKYAERHDLKEATIEEFDRIFKLY
jgi:hypothetical protein